MASNHNTLLRPSIVNVGLVTSKIWWHPTTINYSGLWSQKSKVIKVCYPPQNGQLRYELVCQAFCIEMGLVFYKSELPSAWNINPNIYILS